MAKIFAIFAIVCFGLVSVGSVPDGVPASMEYLTRQKLIYQLYWHIDQPTTVLSELYAKARSFSIEDNLNSYADKDVVRAYLNCVKQGTLPRGAVFSALYPDHLEEAKLLFGVLHTAKNFETFYNTAVKARFNANEKLFTYALSAAVIHRNDTRYVRIPPLYETMPHYFFDAKAINQGYRIKMGDVSVTTPGVGAKYRENGGNEFVIQSNYSGWYLYHDYHSEELLTYFTEDVGLNSYFYYYTHEFPFWMMTSGTSLPKNYRGELYFHVRKQLLARYNLERLSNGLEEIEQLDWRKPIVPGVHPTIVHHNGLPFAHRPSYSDIPIQKYKYVHNVEDIETRISMAIDSGSIVDSKNHVVDIYTPEGINLLANLIEGNADSINPRLYNSWDHTCRKILGCNSEPTHKYQIAPSVLEIFVTSMRDPVFYRMYDRIVGYLLRYKSQLPGYIKTDLEFPGIKIDSVAVDKLVTYFDEFDSDITNAVSVLSEKEAESLNITVRQQRLNHNNFNYHISVSSDKNANAMIRIFLGPKYNANGHELDITDSWNNFVQLDQWDVKLKTGINKIVRNSYNSLFTYPDEMSGPQYWKKLIHAMDTGAEFLYTKQLYNFPDRLVLPKGTKEGMQFKLFVVVSHLEDYNTKMLETPVQGPRTVDEKPMGFPLDRPVHTGTLNLPNMFWKDVVIYHKPKEGTTV